jgi:hypothetical protein
MKQIIVVVAVGIGMVAVGCKGSGGGGGGGGSGSGSGSGGGGGAAFVASLPQVTTADAVLVPTGKPPEILVLVADDGSLRLAAAPATWVALGERDPREGAKPVDLEIVRVVINDSRSLELDGERVMKDVPKPGALMGLSDPQDEFPSEDPPPPEPEDDETGGYTGSNRLPEGKMGPAAEVARTRKHGPMGSMGALIRSAGSGADPVSAGFGVKRDPSLPVRQSDIVGPVIRGPSVEPAAYAVAIASPRAKATALIPVLGSAELIAVAHAGSIRVLRLAFPRGRAAEVLEDPPFVEVRMWPLGLEIEAVPEVPSQVPRKGGYDPAAIAAAYHEAMAKRTLDKDHPVDVLVSPETTVQELIDVVVALELAGATVIGLGQVPGKGDPEAQKRGHR